MKEGLKVLLKTPLTVAAKQDQQAAAYKEHGGPRFACKREIALSSDRKADEKAR